MANISTAKIKINMLKGNEICSDIFTRHPQFKELFAALSYTDRGCDSFKDLAQGYTEESAGTDNRSLDIIDENSCVFLGRWVVAENFTFYRADTRRLMNEVNSLGYTGLSILFWDIEPGEEVVSVGRVDMMLDVSNCTVDVEGMRVYFHVIADKLGLTYPDPGNFLMNDQNISDPDPDYDYEALNKAQDAFEAALLNAISEKDMDWFRQYDFKKGERVIIPLKEGME